MKIGNMEYGICPGCMYFEYNEIDIISRSHCIHPTNWKKVALDNSPPLLYCMIRNQKGEG